VPCSIPTAQKSGVVTGYEVAVLVVVGTATGGLAGWLLTRIWWDRLMRGQERHEVVVTMRSGATYKGVLFEADSRSLILRNAEAWGHNGDGRTAVDGELLLARADVEFLQRP
jgi:small nuclear ribonucleoprotein (snRNP)-like protein